VQHSNNKEWALKMKQKCAGRALAAGNNRHEGPKRDLQEDREKPARLSAFERLKAQVLTKDILNKLDEREAVKQALETHGLHAEELARLAQLQRLPRMVNIIYSMAAGGRKDCWKFAVLVDRLHYSYLPKLEKYVVSASVELLSAVVPWWMEIFKNDLGKFIRVRLEHSPENVKAALQVEIERGMARKASSHVAMQVAVEHAIKKH
jgi:hypothetical protein